jgi:C1A family cysteine protease
MLVATDSRYKLLRADPKDFRDKLYTRVNAPLQKIVDLRPWTSAVEEQGRLGSCTGNAVVGAYELLQNYKTGHNVDLSRLFVYYNSRLLEGSVTQDEGAYIRDAIKALRVYGVCAESLWPYRIDRFAMTPDETSYKDAKKRNIKNYYRLTSIEYIVDALNNNWPVVVGMLVYTSFDAITQNDYVVKLPGKNESPLGAHAMTLVGYDLDKELLLCRNSFGTEWGHNGYCWIPFDYVESEFIDMWIFDIEMAT